MPGCGLQVLARLQQQQQRYREYLVSRYRHLARRSPCQISQYLVQSTDANVYIPALRDVSATFRGSPPAVFPLIGLPIILRLLRCHKKAGLISRYRLGLLTSLSLRCVSYPFFTSTHPLNAILACPKIHTLRLCQLFRFTVFISGHPQYAQFGGPPSTPTSFAPPSQLPHYSGAAPQPETSFSTQIQASISCIPSVLQRAPSSVSTTATATTGSFQFCPAVP